MLRVLNKMINLIIWILMKRNNNKEEKSKGALNLNFNDFKIVYY